MTDADRFHIPPSQHDMAAFANSCMMQSPSQAHPTGMLPQQPTVIATHVVDLSPLVAWWRDELQRLRDQLAVERSATSSAREALAACEERCKAANDARMAALGEANRCAVERDNAVAQLMLAGAHVRNAPALTPGSTAAVIEAYRLLRGAEPRWDGGRREWTGVDEISGHHRRLVSCSTHLLVWLDENAPGGKP